MADQIDNPNSNLAVATVDDLTNQQFAKLMVQAQKAFGSRGQKRCGDTRQQEEVE